MEHENRILKQIKECTRDVQIIEKKVFGEKQRGLLTKRIELIEERTKLKTPKNRPNIFERIAYLYGKIVGDSDPNLINPL